MLPIILESSISWLSYAHSKTHTLFSRSYMNENFLPGKGSAKFNCNFGKLASSPYLRQAVRSSIMCSTRRKYSLVVRLLRRCRWQIVFEPSATWRTATVSPFRSTKWRTLGNAKHRDSNVVSCPCNWPCNSRWSTLPLPPVPAKVSRSDGLG